MAVAPLTLLALGVALLGLVGGFAVPRTGWRIPVHVVTLAALLWGVFRAGVETYEDDPCSAEGSGSCGWAFFQGVWWSTLGLAVGFAVVTVNELRRIRA